ncbi:MAG: dihydropteroate synthase [Polyangiales bacterium]
MLGRSPLTLGSTVWDWSRPYLLGVLNVTPDSFSDGGRYLDPARAVAHGRALLAEGADALDIGGESTRPGAEPVGEAEELRRVIPVIEALRAVTDAPLSIDTTRARVAEAALRAGATVVNDVGLGDPVEALAAVAAAHGAAYIAMHSAGARETVEGRDATAYADVVREVADALASLRDRAVGAGLPPSRVMLDPGVGFAKRAGHSLALLANLGPLRALGHALCVGPSRKSFVVHPDAHPAGWPVDPSPPEARVGGTAAAVALAVWQGAEVLRVHDAAVMAQCARVAQALSLARRAS